MNTFLVVLFATLIPALFVLFIWFLLAPMPSSSEKKILIALAVVGLIICEALFILTARIPVLSDRLIVEGINGMETHINQINPGYTDQVLPTDEVQKILSDTKMLEAYVDESPEAGLVVRLIGAGTFISYVTTFSEAIDSNIEDMKAEGTPITIHNVFDRIHQKSTEPILKVTKILEIVVLVVTGILLLALLIIYFIMKKNASSLSNPKVTVIEQPDAIETGHNRPRGE